MDSLYIKWLNQQGIPLWEGGGTHWRIYQKALVPAQAHPLFVSLGKQEARKLLKESGAWFLRYTSDPTEERTSWWYIVCNSFNLQNLSSNMRNQIKRGLKACTVRIIDANWLADKGYPCYYAAHQRYVNSPPTTEVEFKEGIISSIDGPFEYWGVFVDEVLAGYAKCLIDGKNVATVVIKYHPDYLKHYPSYALIYNLIEHYVVERGMYISNGSRSIAHDTNMQDFLLKFGFKKQYCRINVVYQWWLDFAIHRLYIFRNLISRLPKGKYTNMLKALLFQEELRRGYNNE